ncbi:hypothetical protein [Chroococcidiopsis cubana]|uniref:hypothetical protein n=1 Tax=Chroococcidiopsis cubana TaxID=171392 RepID=UPI000F8E601C|nr:hypothetical protein [Chroococcidiopsis cubana]
MSWLCVCQLLGSRKQGAIQNSKFKIQNSKFTPHTLHPTPHTPSSRTTHHVPRITHHIPHQVRSRTTVARAGSRAPRSLIKLNLRI